MYLLSDGSPQISSFVLGCASLGFEQIAWILPRKPNSLGSLKVPITLIQFIVFVLDFASAMVNRLRPSKPKPN